MNVAAILKQKGRAVTTADPNASLIEVARKLAAKRIGAIVIVGARAEVSGIVSERDIIHALASPEVYGLLVFDRRWSAERYESWLRAILGDQLLS